MRQRRGERPAYRRLSAELRSTIEDGHIDEGGRLPTEAELCKQYSVSRHTVRQAFQDLVAEGLVHRVPGRGTFVTGLSRRGKYLRSIGSLEEVMSWPGTEMELVEPVRVVPDAEGAAHLGLPSEEVATLLLRRFYEEEPFVLTRVYLQPEPGKKLAAELPQLSEGNGRSYGTVIDALERVLATPIAGASQSITAVPVTEEVGGLIGLQTGEPALYVERTYYDGDGVPVETALSYYNPRRYSYRLELRRNMSG